MNSITVLCQEEMCQELRSIDKWAASQLKHCHTNAMKKHVRMQYTDDNRMMENNIV